jgi:pyruvate/2-oxoglutarate dehydrogenase complex dihydrolipoamide dehydrogenase (E3) component
VTVVEAQSRLLPGDEPEAGELLAEPFAAEGISAGAGAGARVDHESGQFSLHLDGGEVVTAGRVLVATGRRTDLAALGVGALGVDEQARTITVDERMRAKDRLWAIGDVTGKGAFTDPEVGSVGLTEAAARDRGLRVRTGVARIPSSTGGWIHKVGNAGLIKSWRTPTAACWSARPPPDLRAVRCSARWPSPSTPRCPPNGYGR